MEAKEVSDSFKSTVGCFVKEENTSQSQQSLSCMDIQNVKESFESGISYTETLAKENLTENSDIFPASTSIKLEDSVDAENTMDGSHIHSHGIVKFPVKLERLGPVVPPPYSNCGKDVTHDEYSSSTKSFHPPHRAFIKSEIKTENCNEFSDSFSNVALEVDVDAGETFEIGYILSSNVASCGEADKSQKTEAEPNSFRKSDPSCGAMSNVPTRPNRSRLDKSHDFNVKDFEEPVESNEPSQEESEVRAQTREMIDQEIFPCTKCYLAFSTDILLQRHLYKYHYDEFIRMRKEFEQGTSQSERNSLAEKAITCSMVYDNTFRQYDSRQQLRMNDGEKQYKCIICEKAFRCSLSLNRHMRTHDENKPYKCTICDKAFRSRNYLPQHMRIHSGEKPYRCTVCDKTFSLSVSLRYHRRIHDGKKSYRCSDCDKEFSQNSYLRTHMKIHKGEKPYKCTVCGKAFIRTHTLKQHMRIHDRKLPYKCTVSDRAFSQLSSLQQHRNRNRRVHDGERPYKCTVCDKAFGRNDILQRHMKIHNEIKPFNCTVCGEGFSLNHKLQYHMGSHDGTLPHKCSVCEKAFRLNYNLRKHMRVHDNGEKPYKCSVCDKDYRFNCDLRRHTRVHNGEKPYKCSVCDKGFSRSDYRQKHMQTHK